MIVSALGVEAHHFTSHSWGIAELIWSGCVNGLVITTLITSAVTSVDRLWFVGLLTRNAALAREGSLSLRTPA